MCSRACKHIFLLLAALLLAGCASPRTAPRRLAQADPHPVIWYALTQLGAPYRYGGDSPAGFDCSGLIQYSYHQTGRSVPRTAHALWRAGKTVPRDQARPGDLMFYHFNNKVGGLHVGLYLGNHRMIHASAGHDSVVEVDISKPWWRSRFLAAKRLPVSGVSGHH